MTSEACRRPNVGLPAHRDPRWGPTTCSPGGGVDGQAPPRTWTPGRRSGARRIERIHRVGYGHIRVMTLLLLLACTDSAPSLPGGAGKPRDTVDTVDRASSLPSATLVHDDGTVPVAGELPRVRVQYGATAEQYLEPRVKVSAPTLFSVRVDGSATSADGPDYWGDSIPAEETIEGDSTFWVRIHSEREPNALERQCDQRGTLATLTMSVEVRTEATTWAPIDIASEVQLVSTDFLDEQCTERGY